MPEITVADVHVDRLITDLSVDWVQAADRYVSPFVFPIVPVNNRSDLFLIWDRGSMLRNEMSVRPIGERPRQVKRTSTTGTYLCEERALEYPLDDRFRANRDEPFDDDIGAAKYLTAQAWIDADSRWAASFFKAGVWTTDVTGVAAAPGADQFLQFNQSGSKPFDDIRAQIKAVDELTGFPPNVAVLGSDVWNILADHPDALDRIKHVMVGIVTPQLIAQALGLNRVLVAGGIENTAAEGATDVFARIVDPKGVLLAHASDNPGRDRPSGGYTFAWQRLIPGATNSMGGVIERGREPLAHSDIFQVRTATDPQLVAADLGVFMASAVA